MSGFAAIALGVLSQATFLTGGAPVILGDFVFQDFEVPAEVHWGGKQRLTVHKYPGGARTIDAMGRDDVDVAWSGTMLGGLAQQRAAQLDKLRTAAAPLQLIWGAQARTVVIASLDLREGFQRVAYSIACTASTDDTGVAGIAPSPLAQIGSDLSSALGFL